MPDIARRLIAIDAQVQAAPTAEYYQLGYKERLLRYPASTLRFVSTSQLPVARRREQVVTAGQPGIENRLEAEICAALVREYSGCYPLNEITVITPYRRQLRLLRKMLSAPPAGIAAAEWEQFVHQRISTVDSFQGGESDVVIISYVRSGGRSVGFVDDPNRVNVTHTRSRREMIVVGDAEFLAKKSRGRIFVRMLRAITRDGVVEELDEAALAALSQCDDWLNSVLGYLKGNRDMLAEFVESELPGVTMHPPAATYLAWLDFRGAGLGDEPAKHLLEHAKVGLNEGSTFGRGGAGFVRLNFATSSDILRQGLDRIRDALT